MNQPRIENDTLIIPFDSDPKYHHWKNGQTQIEILAELKAPVHVFAKYTRHNEGHTGDTCICGKAAKSTNEVFYCVPCHAYWEKP